MFDYDDIEDFDTAELDPDYLPYDDEPFDIDDDRGMNPYDGTYDSWQDESDYWEDI